MPMNTDVTMAAHAVKVLFDRLQVEHRTFLQGMNDIQLRHAERASLRELIRVCKQQIVAVEHQLNHFPVLPSLQVIQWAQSTRLFPNLVFLEVDTTGVYSDAEILRVYVLAADQSVLLDLYARPSEPLTPQITRITGMTDEQVNQCGLPIETVLERLRETLCGKYVLSYNMNFDVSRLRDATTRAQIPEMVFVGEDVMEKAITYFSCSSYYPKLEALCRMIGHPLPSRPNQQAQHRAQGQYHLLHAMAACVQGETSADVAEEREDVPDEDEHPF